MKLRRGRSRGIAAVEFAITCPLLLIMVGGVSDLGIAVWSRSCLANAVAQGVEYALVHTQGGGTVTHSQIVAVVQGMSSLPSIDASGTTTPAWYCVNSSTTPATLSASTQGTTCPDGTTAGQFVKVAASYRYTPRILPQYDHVTAFTLSASTWVRLQ